MIQNTKFKAALRRDLTAQNIGTGYTLILSNATFNSNFMTVRFTGAADIQIGYGNAGAEKDGPIIYASTTSSSPQEEPMIVNIGTNLYAKSLGTTQTTGVLDINFNG